MTSHFVINNLKDIDIIDTESGFIIFKFNYYDRKFKTYYLPTHHECDYHEQLVQRIKLELNKNSNQQWTISTTQSMPMKF